MSKSVPVPDLAAVLAFQTPVRGPRCNVALTLSEVDEQTRVTLQAAVDAPQRFNGASITRWLNSLDIHLSATSIQRHRRKECTCGRS